MARAPRAALDQRGTALRDFGAFVKRALDRSHHVISRPCRNGRWPLGSGRWLLACAVAASLSLSALGPTPPVRAAPAPDPDARLQLVIKSVYIRENENLLGSADLD